MFDTFITWSGWLFGLAGLLFGWWQHRLAANDRRQLAIIRRRAVAPYLAPSSQRFQYVIEDTGEPGKMTMWHAHGQNVLCSVCDEVCDHMEKDNPVIFVVENNGKACPRVSIKLDGKEVAMVSEPDINNANGLQFIKYPFDPDIRGKEQKIELWFECDGIQDTHTYRTFHGRRVLARIDPA